QDPIPAGDDLSDALPCRLNDVQHSCRDMCFSDFADHTFATSAVASCIRRKLFSRHGIAGIGAADMKNPGTYE
ncbi:hypothetical protein, partial [Alistipes finegoldii]|uniref:hypothetical protein n=1 Tax=Alistipes finegoldii TaxID=214856 RepID=UPI003AF13970